MHVVWSVQYALPLTSWNFPFLQVMQLPKSAEPENWPAGQSAHRSGVSIVVSFSYLPGLHGCFLSQYDWPGLSWYLPVGHLVQMLLVFENSPAEHCAHDTSAVALPGLATRWPAAHLLCSKQ